MGGRSAALLVLAEAAASPERGDARLLAEILADAALAAEAANAGAIRHRAVAGKLAEIARRTGPAAFRDAAITAADPPPDDAEGQSKAALREGAARAVEKSRLRGRGRSECPHR